MAKFRLLTTAEKTNVVRLHGMGKSQKEIAEIYSINQSSVSRILGAKTSLMTKRSGRPRKTTKKTDSLISREVKKNPFISAREIKNSTPLLQNVSERTIRHRLSKDLKMPARKPRKKPLLTKKMRLKRLSFCKQHLRWTTEQWEKVMFSDESLFRLVYSAKSFVRRPYQSCPETPALTIQQVRHSQSVMVWACFSAFGRGALFFLEKGESMNAKKYRDVLEGRLLTFMNIHQCNVFQQDSAPCHKARSVMKWFESNDICLLDWPGNSPDLNPIENLWFLIKKRVSERNCSTLDQLKGTIKSVWCTEITRELCQNLVHSMPKRLTSVIKNKGFPTKY